MTDDVYTRAAKALGYTLTSSSLMIREELTRANLAIVDAGELARLRETLKPFALFADALAKDRKLTANDPVFETGNAMCEMTLAYSVFQQARAALSPNKPTVNPDS